jgi:PelA/Pel-15E family pectate lyase
MKTIARPMTLAIVVISSLAATAAYAQSSTTGANFSRQPDSWFTSDAGTKAIDIVISWQRPEGGWEKGYDKTKIHETGKPYGEWGDVSTIDNGITYTEIRDLARAYRLTKRNDALGAVNKGLDLLFTMQYPSGGWPQRFPLQNNYGRYITFNDDAMVNVMRLMDDVAKDGDGQFSFIDADRRQKAKAAFDKGIDCILKAQIKQNGVLTAWPQQCDPQTLAPTNARAYELPSISGSESAGVMKLLMQQDNPTDAMVRAVHAAARWYEKSKITGKRLERANGDVVVVDDPAAPPLWARFYELDTNRPFFCGRDGVKKYSLAEIEKERRTGYAWLRDWGKTVLNDYKKWAVKHPAPATQPA